MIQSNELRRNNLLDVDGNYCKVDAILENELYFKENPEYNHLLNAKGIPLKEEILLKCGFKRDGWSYISKHGIYKFHAQSTDENGSFINTEFYKIRQGGNINNKKDYTILSFNIDYLHQLQNIIYVLTGKELEINL